MADRAFDAALNPERGIIADLKAWDGPPASAIVAQAIGSDTRVPIQIVLDGVHQRIGDCEVVARVEVLQSGANNRTEGRTFVPAAGAIFGNFIEAEILVGLVLHVRNIRSDDDLVELQPALQEV